MHLTMKNGVYRCNSPTDVAGHDILMATMLNGAAVMDGALLLIAANETCPQPQTSEHLAAVEIMRLEHIIILQNKIDLIRCTLSAMPERSLSTLFISGEFGNQCNLFHVYISVVDLGSGLANDVK